MKKKNYLDVSGTTLTEWLSLLNNPPKRKQFIDYCFPTEKHRVEFLLSIQSRSEKEILNILLKFLIPTGTLSIDEFHAQSFLAALKSGPEHFQEIKNSQFYQRVITYYAGLSKIPPWEGITWILDLLPHFPKEALAGLSAYTLAHIQELPDGRMDGLFDAEEIIRAKYIGSPTKQSEFLEILLEVSPRSFECIIEQLYSHMGYDTILTPPQKDGGRDVIASKSETAKLEQLRIECKQYTKPVSVSIVRALLGVVSDEKVNKGVVVTTSGFTKGAIDFCKRNPRLELISGSNLIPLLNEYFGSRWPIQIDRIITDSQLNNKSRRQ